MIKKEVKFWTLVSKIKQSKHILDIALEFDKNSITAQKYNKIIGDQEQELYNYIIECDIPLKVIPTYFDNIRNSLIVEDRKIDKREIRRIKKRSN